MTNHLLQSTVFAALAAMLTLALRNNHARTRYWIWLVASMKFLIPFSLFVELGHRLTWQSAPVVTQPRVAFVMDQISQPFAATDVAVAAPSIVPALLLAIWICGLAAVLIVWFARWRHVAAVLRTGSLMSEGRELNALRRFDTDIKLISCPAQIEPGVFGILRPVLSLPAGIADHLDDAQLDAIFAHELCHVKHRDNLTAALHMLVEAMFWFHPLVWWIGAKLVEERERACDEEVVQLGSDPEIYAESILKICKLYLESPLACVSGVTGSNLKRRIEAIMTNRVVLKLNFVKKAALATASTIALAIPVTIGIVNIHAQTKPATPKFEVASVKRCNLDDPPAGQRGARGGGGLGDSGLFRTPCVPLQSLIRMAYIHYADGRALPEGSMLKEMPVQGLPDWTGSDRYTIEAKPASPQTLGMMAGPMLQALLEDRFKLKLHHESKEVPVYALVVAKGGSRLQPTKPEGCTPVDPQGPRPQIVPGQPLPCGFVDGDETGIRYVGATVATMLRELPLGREVVDKTGLTGLYDYHLDVVVGAPGSLPRPDDPGYSDMIATVTSALQKLGLRVESAKGSAEFVVVDHIERPSEN